jgi:hypothetical protein
MRILHFALLSALVVPLTTSAQESPEGWVVPFAAAQYPTSVPAFNHHFVGLVPEARTRHLGWGIEVRSLVGNFLIGPLYLRTWDEVADSLLQLRTDATAVFGTAGLKLTPFSFLALVPSIGIGGLNQSFAISQRTGDIALDSLLPAPGRAVTFSPGTRLAGLAALELCLSVSTSAGRYGLSLRGGYAYSPFNLTWQLGNGSRLTDAPAAKLGGPFITAGLALVPSAVTEGPVQP